VDGNNALRLMGDTSKDWHVPAVAGITVEQTITLLDRAAEVGLLASYGVGYYRIHPALPWFFRRMYMEYYPDDLPARAYVETVGALGDYYAEQYVQGNQAIIALLKMEEANLLHARRLAQQHGWYHRITSTMQGLSRLYSHTGRRAEWQRLVEEIVPLFVDPASDGPLLEREKQWHFVMQYRTYLHIDRREWDKAQRLQSLQVDYFRQQATPLLALPREQLNNDQFQTLRSLAVALDMLSSIQREQGHTECVDMYQSAYEIKQHIQDTASAAITAFNLGRVHDGTISTLRNLDKAEQWYQKSLALRANDDMLGKSGVLAELGYVAWARFDEARKTGQSFEVLSEHLNVAFEAYQKALQLVPSDAVNELAKCNNQLGQIYREAGKTEQAVAHYREAIRYFEQAGALYNAAITRENVAIAYAQAGRFEDALLFARAALANYEQFGPAAAAEAEQMRGLVAEIERLARGGGA
jgi:tetratricopeptide (TPR) repeat protein